MKTERLLAFLVGIGAVMMLSACERPAKEVAEVVVEKPEAAILLGEEDAVDFREFLDGVVALGRRTPVRFRHPELAAEIEFRTPGFGSPLFGEGSTIQVRGDEVAMDGEVVSLSELEAKARVYADAARTAGSNPVISIDSNLGVSFARGLEVLKVLSKVGIVVIDVSDSLFQRNARENARPKAPWQAKPVNPSGR